MAVNPALVVIVIALLFIVYSQTGGDIQKVALAGAGIAFFLFSGLGDGLINDLSGEKQKESEGGYGSDVDDSEGGKGPLKTKWKKPESKNVRGPEVFQYLTSEFIDKQFKKPNYINKPNDDNRIKHFISQLQTIESDEVDFIGQKFSENFGLKFSTVLSELRSDEGVSIFEYMLKNQDPIDSINDRLAETIYLFGKPKWDRTYIRPSRSTKQPSSSSS